MVKGKTSFEAAFRKKPNLSGMREWGDKVWVCVEAGNKLDGRVREGHWMGIDEKSKGVRVYWPDKRNITIECNAYYDQTCSSVSCLKGEDWNGFIQVETKPNSPDLDVKPDISNAKPDVLPPKYEIPSEQPVPDPGPSFTAEDSTSEIET